jgi:S1-C subfamily serine protease
VETSDDQERVVVYPDADEALKDQTRAERSEALDRRAGEQIGDDPQGRAGVLGMYVQEADGDRVEVVEVGAATPAFDAGIRKGDVLISFDGFKADSYRKWVDGIRKLVNDAPEGDTMPIQLVRDGKRLNLRLRK